MPMWILAAVRLRLGDTAAHNASVLQPAAQPRADKRLGTCHRVNRIIARRQSAHRLRHLSFLF